MLKMFNSLLMKIVFRFSAASLMVVIFAGLNFSVSSLPITFMPAAFAVPNTGALPKNWESYLNRPDILELPAYAQNPDPNWAALKAAHFSFVAELLSLYSPDTHLYFLARDSEYIYDVARLVTSGTLDSERVHLINVSRTNMRDSNLKTYLEENGISEQTIANGKKIVFIDTGFSGTIPRVLGELFPVELRNHLKTHLVVSSNPDHPSSRAFLIHLNPLINEQSPSTMHGSIVNYEYMARSMDRSHSYFFMEGRSHPVSTIAGTSEGKVSKQQSLQLMMDLKAEWEKPEVKVQFQKDRAQVLKIKQILLNPSSDSKEELKKKLHDSRNSASGRLLEAQVRDIFGAKTNAGIRVAIKLGDLGLTAGNGSELDPKQVKKNELMDKSPEWALVLENPVDVIPKLFSENNWQMIEELIEANVDIEINDLIAESLYDGPAQGKKRDLQIIMIKKGDPQTIERLIEISFSKPAVEGMKDIIKVLIEQGNSQVFRKLAEFTFSQPHTKEMGDLIQLLIEKGDASTLPSLALYTFPQPHTKDMITQLKHLVKKSEFATIHYLNTKTFTQPHTKSPAYVILQKSLSIASLADRSKWIDEELLKLNSPLVEASKSSERNFPNSCIIQLSK